MRIISCTIMQIVSFVVERKIHLGRVKSGLRCKCDLSAIFALKIFYTYFYLFLSTYYENCYSFKMIDNSL